MCNKLAEKHAVQWLETLGCDSDQLETEKQSFHPNGIYLKGLIETDGHLFSNVVHKIRYAFDTLFPFGL